MDQSQSSKPGTAANIPTAGHIPLPKRTFSMELLVGIFALAGVLCAGYLSIRLGELQLFQGKRYSIFAQFDNVSGLKSGASVEVAGVPIAGITLDDPMAKVEIQLFEGMHISDDDIASIRTKGIIGDRYIKISRGSSTTYIKPGGLMTETESVVDLEDLIGKFVHQMGSKDDKEE